MEETSETIEYKINKLVAKIYNLRSNVYKNLGYSTKTKTWVECDFLEMLPRGCMSYNCKVPFNKVFYHDNYLILAITDISFRKHGLEEGECEGNFYVYYSSKIEMFILEKSFPRESGGITRAFLKRFVETTPMDITFLDGKYYLTGGRLTKAVR